MESTVASTEAGPDGMDCTDTAPASQATPDPPVFRIELPLAVTLTMLLNTTCWQTVGIMVGVPVGVLVGGLAKEAAHRTTFWMLPYRLLMAVSTSSGYVGVPL